MDTTFTNAPDRKTTMTTRTSPLAAALVAALLAACGQQAKQPAPGDGATGGAHEALTGQPICAGPGVHDVHVAEFRCDTCHPTGATFGFDRPYTFPSGLTSTAGGTFVRDAAGVTCTVACHFPRGGASHPVSWTTPGPLACTACHATDALPAAHPPVAANATRADCQGCHVLDGHMSGPVVVRGHGPGWADPVNPLHAPEANANPASCRGCHGETLDGGAGRACATCHDVGLPAGVASWKVNCVMCHGGTDLQNGAPPRNTWGNEGDAVRTGAHTRHLVASAIAPAATCAACHATPSDVFTAGHVDGGTAEVVFGRALPGRTQAWDRAGATCTNTYCHAAAAGGTHQTPVWTRVGQGEAACGTCHGLPPPAPHPSAGDLTSCASCHSLTMTAAGAVIPPSQGGLHLDGTVEATGGHPAAWSDRGSSDFHAFSANRGLAACQGCHGQALDGVGGSTSVGCQDCHGAGFTSRCTGCHGGTDNQTGAPPRTTWGQSADALRTGAHTRHVTAGAVSGAVACSTCHAVPADAFAAGHLGDGPAEVVLTGLAAAGGAAPAYARPSGTCSSTYCHGGYSGTFEYTWAGEPRSFAYAGRNATPGWTGTAACGTCHGNPPPGSWHGLHNAGNQCELCHPDATGLPGSAVVSNPALHVNGIVEVTPQWRSSCLRSCH